MYKKGAFEDSTTFKYFGAPLTRFIEGTFKSPGMLPRLAYGKVKSMYKGKQAERLAAEVKALEDKGIQNLLPEEVYLVWYRT